MIKKQYGVSKQLSITRLTQVVFCILVLHTGVYAQQLQWFSYQDNYPRKMVTDAQGSIYVTGTDVYDNSVQNMNVFVRKYTASGDLLWERKSTTPYCCSFSDSRGIAVDAQGNVYVAGNFQSRIQFDNILLEASYSDIFLVKYTSTGTLLWATSLYSSTEFEGDEFVSDLKIDLQNNPVLIGTFQKEMRMDSTTVIYPAEDAPVTGMSSYILKASSAGIWQSLERLDIHLAYSLEINASGDYIIGGTHKSHVMPHYYTDPETGEPDTTYIEMYDIALAKYASGGALLWSHQYGSYDLQDHLYEMKIDTAGNAYVTGYDAPPLGPAAAYQVVFTRINSSGALQWTRAYKLSGYTPGDSFICTEVAIDNDQQPVFAGQFKGTITLEGQAFTSVSSRDMIIARYDQNGNIISAFTASGTGDDVLSDMVVSNDNSLYLTGFTYPYSSARMGSVATAATTPLHFISKYSLMATPAQTVRGYTLIDAISGQPISELEEGDTINLVTLRGRKINIRVNTDPSIVGSVKMTLNGKSRTDNTAPYSVRGDINGAYVAWTPAPHKYTLTATAYSSANAGGEEGGSRTVTFYVVARPTSMPATTPLSEKLTVYPNPVLSHVTITATRPLENNIGIQIVDFSGQVRHQSELRVGESSRNIDLSKLPKGVYVLKMTSGAEGCARRIIKE